MPLVRRIPEMIESDPKERTDRCKAGDVAAQVAFDLVRLDHHDHGIPARVGANALLQGMVAGGALLHVRRDGIEIGSLRVIRQIRARTTRFIDEFFQQVVRTVCALTLEHGLHGIEPLLGLKRIGVVGGGKFGDCGHDYLINGGILETAPASACIQN